MTTGEKIRRHRHMMGLTQKELADRIGYKNYTAIAKIETSSNGIPLPKIKAIANVFGISPAELMDDETDEHTSEQELLDCLESIKRRPEMKALFSTAKNCSTEDIEKAKENLMQGQVTPSFLNTFLEKVNITPANDDYKIEIKFRILDSYVPIYECGCPQTEIGTRLESDKSGVYVVLTMLYSIL